MFKKRDWQAFLTIYDRMRCLTHISLRKMIKRRSQGGIGKGLRHGHSTRAVSGGKPAICPPPRSRAPGSTNAVSPSMRHSHWTTRMRTIGQARPMSLFSAWVMQAYLPCLRGWSAASRLLRYSALILRAASQVARGNDCADLRFDPAKLHPDMGHVHLASLPRLLRNRG